MKVVFQVSRGDALRAREFYQSRAHTSFVKERIRRNVEGARPPRTLDGFWRAHLSCLLTSQQRSGPGSPVSKFLRAHRFPVPYEQCHGASDVEEFVRSKLKRAGGIRLYNNVARFAARNAEWLAIHGWNHVRDRVAPLAHGTASADEERVVADYFVGQLHGIGPKQSRNLLQLLGLTKYEVPIDSRVARWLNDFGFPLHVSATALGDLSYYHLVSDGFRALCEAADVYPCVMDAAIFGLPSE
jgi:hypothetical protein